jgi:hypothetical protein
MGKRGMVVWEVLIWAIILLVVAIVLIYSFQKLFGRQTTTLDEEISDLRDPDDDLIPNKFDCCDNDYGSASNKGCPDGERPDLSTKSDCRDKDAPPDS